MGKFHTQRDPQILLILQMGYTNTNSLSKFLQHKTLLLQLAKQLIQPPRPSSNLQKNYKQEPWDGLETIYKPKRGMEPKLVVIKPQCVPWSKMHIAINSIFLTCCHCVITQTILLSKLGRLIFLYYNMCYMLHDKCPKLSEGYSIF